MWTAIHIDHAPGVGAGNVEQENRFQFRNFDELESRRQEKRWAAAGFATDLRGVEIRLPGSILVKGPGPGLQRNVGRARIRSKTGTRFLISFVVRRGTEIGVSVWPAWRGWNIRCGRRWRCRLPSPLSAAPTLRQRRSGHERYRSDNNPEFAKHET